YAPVSCCSLQRIQPGWGRSLLLFVFEESPKHSPCVLSIFDFQVPVINDIPTFDQKAVRVVVRPTDVAQPTLRDQISRDDAGRADDLLGSVTAEIKGVAAGVQGNTVHCDLLADIATDDIAIITALFQVIIEPL